MNGYEIIKRNINFDNPDRIGLRYDRIAQESDVFRIFVLPATESRESTKAYSVTKKVKAISDQLDEWGCLWQSDDPTGADMGQVKNIPLSEWDLLKDYKVPDPFATGRFDGLNEALEIAENRQLYIQLNSPHCIFERIHFVRGFENLMMDCILETDNLKIFAQKLADYQIGIIEHAYQVGKGRIHCYDTTDDLGTQTNLMFSPEVFREIFKPQYERIFKKAHDCKMDVRFHTDGKVNAVLEDIIEAGANIINIHQPQLLGIDEVSKMARGKVCFEVSIDIQSTLPTGDKKLIEAEARELVEKWATPHGGLIGVEYGYLNAIGTTKESMLFGLECFKKYGMYKKNAL